MITFILGLFLGFFLGILFTAIMAMSRTEKLNHQMKESQARSSRSCFFHSYIWVVSPWAKSCVFCYFSIISHSKAELQICFASPNAQPKTPAHLTGVFSCPIDLWRYFSYLPHNRTQCERWRVAYSGAISAISPLTQIENFDILASSLSYLQMYYLTTCPLTSGGFMKWIFQKMPMRQAPRDSDCPLEPLFSAALELIFLLKSADF